MEENNVEIKKKNSALKKELLLLGAKIIVIIAAFAVIFNFIFGVSRYPDNSMEPAIKSGDLVLYYRLDKSCVARDVVVVEYEGKRQVRRVVATAGDTVDITENGLLINGSIQNEPNIYFETLPYVEGISFPITLGKDELFLLSDNRTDSMDSRVYGPVNESSVLGKVMSVFRRRDI